MWKNWKKRKKRKRQRRLNEEISEETYNWGRSLATGMEEM
jgi:hypothetical protein